MNLVSNGILIVSAASVTLGLIHLRMCFERTNRLSHLLFVLSSFSLAVYALIERAMMQTASPVEYGELLRYQHIAVLTFLLPAAWFVHLYLGTGRKWLLYSMSFLRVAALVLNFIFTPNLNFREITAINRVSFLGEIVSVPVGIPNPWMLVGQASLLLFVIFCLDAVFGVWRLDQLKRGLTIGVTVGIFSISSLIMAISVFWGFIQVPLIASPFFIFVVFAMGYELSRDLQRAAQLAEDLKKREADLEESLLQLKLSAGAAGVGVWSRNVGDNAIWANEKWRELFDYSPSATITFNDYLYRIHPDDREQIEDALKAAENNGGISDNEYRILLRTGDSRWIASRGGFDYADGKPVRYRGASVDVTKRKLAEKAAHDLSQKLINAQEKERARLARELHDDLSQSLALLSIQLTELGRESLDAAIVKERVRSLSEQIKHLSADVHRISHELHPAKLGQLGLEAALRGFCREIGSTHLLHVEFDASNVPRSLTNDLSLCLYRVTQEALQNVIKHSGASHANVTLDSNGSEITLSVSDNGCGFKAEREGPRGSLGLISMSERIRAVQGSVTIESNETAGTRITARAPLQLN